MVLAGKKEHLMTNRPINGFHVPLWVLFRDGIVCVSRYAEQPVQLNEYSRAIQKYKGIADAQTGTGSGRKNRQVS